MDKRRATPTYTDQDKAEFCDVAKEIGIGRAMRQLGYPLSYLSGVQWMKARGIEPNVMTYMQNIKAYHTYYQVEDLLVTMDNAISTAEELMMAADNADDMKKIADALYKIVQTRQLLEGKATAISEKRETTQADLALIDLINAERARNAGIEEDLLGDSGDMAQIEGPKEEIF